MKIKNLEKIDEIKNEESKARKKLFIFCLLANILICLLVAKIPTDSFETTVSLMILIDVWPIIFCGAVFLNDLSANKSKYNFWENIEKCKLHTIKPNGTATIKYENNFDKNKEFIYNTTWIVDSSVTEIQYDIQKDLIILPLSNV